MADTIYVAGGLPNADISQKGVYSAATNPDGTLGAWQQVTALPQGLHDHSAAAVGRTMYIIGGFNTATGRYTDATYVASVQCD
jgi:N-acetylneuraminic acid mutarotase